MGEELSFDNILNADEISNLFQDDEVTETQETNNNDVPETNNTPSSKEEVDNNKEEQETAEIPLEKLFESESVGSEEDNEEGKKPKSNKAGTSPDNLYSSIAKALKEEGVFPDLDDEAINNASEPESFRDLIDQQIKMGLDETQKRINDALNSGMEVSEIKQYENVLDYLNSITDKTISEEGDDGETLRKRLIFQDFINRGYSEERAKKEVNKSLNAGTDIDDAKDALVSNKEFYKSQYEKIIKQGQEEKEREAENRKKEIEKLKKDILDSNKVFGDIELDKSTRQKVIDNIVKPIYKDNDGNVYNAIQKYEMDNRTEFIKNVSLLFTLTDGFKNIDRLVKGKVKKEVSKGLRDLESKINSTSRAADGSLKFMSGVKDNDSYDGIDWNKLNI